MIDIENLIIYADLLLEKVFYNLVKNALRHGKGVTRITFSSVPMGDNILIVCEDNGKGIPEKYKEAIFNRQHYKHTGFGLFLSREILDITGLTIHETVRQVKVHDLRSQCRQDISASRTRWYNLRVTIHLM